MLPKLTLLFLLLVSTLCAQHQNITQVGHLPYPADRPLNDIWGYVAPDGTEYALVGTRKGLSIVSLADPTQPEEVHFVAGDSIRGRDIKTFGETAYVIGPKSEEGLWVVDLSNLPLYVTHYREQVTTTLNGVPDTLRRGHNLFVDEQGLIYLAGSNLNNGGVVVLVVTLFGPEVVGYGPPVYTHDVFIDGDVLYASEFQEGRFSVYDISDPTQFELLGSADTPRGLTHNVWTSPNGNYAFTTDERPEATVASFDISDFSDIRLLDQIRADTAYGNGQMPHNVLALDDDYLFTAHFRAGLTLIDASEPDNLIQVGQFFTSDPEKDYDFLNHGAWGAYPFLPSGLILVSDIEEGLFVVEVDYRRAARFEGTVLHDDTNQPLFGVRVEYERETIQSGLDGRFRGGLPATGTVQLKLSKPGFYPLVTSIDLLEGETRELTLRMVPLPELPVTGRISDRRTDVPLDGALVSLRATGLYYATTADADGRYRFEAVPVGPYTLAVGRWDHLPRTDSLLVTPNSTHFEYALELGYGDDFNQDFGWTLHGNATHGIWQRGAAVPNTLYGDPSNPTADTDADGIVSAYVTGLAGGIAHENDLDGGTSILVSPVMDLQNYALARIEFSYWWLNENQRDRMDSLQVFLASEADTIQLLSLEETTARSWQTYDALVPEDFLLTADVRLLVVAGDNNFSNTIEAGFDAFRLVPLFLEQPTILNDEVILVNVFPNPFAESTTVAYHFREPGTYAYRVVDLLGRELRTEQLPERTGRFSVSDLPSGQYYLVFTKNGALLEGIGLVRVGE